MGVERVVELAVDLAGSAPVRAMAADLVADSEKIGAVKAAQNFLQETWAGSRTMAKSVTGTTSTTTMADGQGLEQSALSVNSVSGASSEQTAQLLPKLAGPQDVEVVGVHEAPSVIPAGQHSGDSLLSRAEEIQGIAPHNQKGFLPAGIYKADWNDFVLKLGFNSLRMEQINKVAPLFQELKGMGLDDVYLGGSFVTKRAAPHDLDIVAALRPDHSAMLWQRLSDLATNGHKFGEHMMISDAAEGLGGGNLKVMRFNTRPGMPQEELGIVHLQLPTLKKALYY